MIKIKVSMTVSPVVKILELFEHQGVRHKRWRNPQLNILKCLFKFILLIGSHIGIVNKGRCEHIK